MNTETRPISNHLATLAGGCFWCLEPIFSNLIGVLKVTSGYAGRSTKSPTYQEICTGATGHAECIQIKYVPQEIPYDTLLDVFFAYHDPITPNQQGNDIGTQYRSAIFAHSDIQFTTAANTIELLTNNQIFNNPIVTELTILKKFYKAEDYHQEYFLRNPDNPYCNAMITPKLHKLRLKHSHLLKST